MKKLSIVITTLDDPELPETIKSIRDTAGDDPEIIVVNDGSKNYILSGDGINRLVNNPNRCGVGPSRTIGVHCASKPNVLLCDSHMRFIPGWYEAALTRMEGRPKTIHCGTMAGLDDAHMDPAKPASYYYGGTLNVYGRDPNKGSNWQVMEAVWNAKPPEDDAEIAAVIGASYFMTKEWFLKLDALRHLRTWGMDEVFLSVKSWLCGGDCRLMRNVVIGHVHQEGKQNFKVPFGHPGFNKLFGLHTLLVLDPELLETLLYKTNLAYGGGELFESKKMLSECWHLVEVERSRNKAMFVRDFGWLRDKFKL